MVERPSPLRLGTRGSPLAVVQANMVASALCATHGWEPEAVEIVTVKTSGDRIQDRALADIGGKALWTKELDRALIDGDIHFAVHSMKDVETIRPAEIAIAAMLPRADVRDKLVGAESLAELREGAVLGTSSPRRAAQVRRMRPDITTTLFRGNVATRLAKVTAGEVDATLLAAAGLDRLGQHDIGNPIPIDVMMPAPAQGAVGIETLAANTEVIALLAAISDADTLDCVLAERALLLALGGNCHSPIGALARIEGDAIFLTAEILTGDGSERVSDTALFPRDDLSAASDLGRALLTQATPAIRALFDGVPEASA
ncbi:hydroxymethylbilane synthase [Sphingobium sp. BS19]|uniref:hydroxymethylbilane synthase n=1 Tax=Sphingobium sp. BS19 TaxID=3018973 RepID=UPI0022ED9D04|nr:hydroxymethylbilane synthase [Sphingobium sp. BS19]GLI98947.1 porphobilinogen deaminase [Sphingobium sp. BS19]